MSDSVRHPHWTPPDLVGDLLAIARTPGVAPPREIRIRPELYARVLAQLEPTASAAVSARRALGEGAGIPLVVDPSLPGFPGFEVVRARPGSPDRPHVAAA